MWHTFDHGTYNANRGLGSNLVVYVGSAMSVAHDISFWGSHHRSIRPEFMQSMIVQDHQVILGTVLDTTGC